MLRFWLPLIAAVAMYCASIKAHAAVFFGDPFTASITGPTFLVLASPSGVASRPNTK